MVSQVQNLGLANIVSAWHAFATRMRYLQWGVGSGQAVTDTGLDDTTGTTENRTAGTTSEQTTTTTGDTFRVEGTITAAGARAITEIGVWDAAGSGSPPTGGNLGIYADFAVINLATDDYIEFTIDVVFDQG